MNYELLIELGVRGIGLAQLGLSGFGLTVPWLLGWKAELEKMKPMMGRLFWVYSAYVLGTNLFFGIYFLLRPQVLMKPSEASFVIAFYLFLYWGVRWVLELCGFDCPAVPDVAWARWGRRVLMVVFGGMTAFYAFLAWRALA